MPVTLRRTGAVGVVTIDSPATANAWTLEMQRSWTEILAACAADEDVRAVVVTGAGRYFCAGADLSLLERLRAGEPPPAELRPEAFLRAAEHPLPLIAAVNGPAVGMGVVHALMCDVRIAAPGASFSAVFARLGLVAEHAVSWFLAQIVGRGAALELLLSGRTVGAEEALSVGLVQRIVPPDELLPAAVDYAARAVGDGPRNGWAEVRRLASRPWPGPPQVN